MKVILIRYTPNPASVAGMAAALCTDSDDYERSLRGAMSMGHASVSEHASFSFLIEDVSRTLLAQITRHRIASFSVQSQRYVDMGKMPVVVPETIVMNEKVMAEWEKVMEHIRGFYRFAVNEGIPKEDARYAAPNAACTKLLVTMNARELRHFFSLRCCRRAQWEIRDLADEMWKLCMSAAPELFRRSGPGCVSGKCPEGKMSCAVPRNAEFEQMEREVNERAVDKEEHCHG